MIEQGKELLVRTSENRILVKDDSRVAPFLPACNELISVSDVFKR